MIIKKTSIFYGLLFTLTFVVIAFLSLPFNNEKPQSVLANATDDDNPEVTILQTGETLYMQLLFVRDGIYPDDISIVEPLRRNTFINLTELDLSNCNNLYSDGNLSYVGGLAFFKFNNLQVLNLSNNDITEVPGQTFNYITSLNTLDISNNEINEIEFGNLVSVQNLYAQNNKLSSIDLSSIENKQDGMGNINLAHNNLKKISNVLLPSASHPKHIELFGNNIIDANINVSVYAPHQLNFIIQSIKQDIEIDDKTEITVFPSFNLNNFKVKVTKIDTTTHTTFEVGKHFLGVGEYKAEIYDGDTNLSELLGTIYKSFTFTVVKASPTVEAYIDGKLIDYNTKITKPVTLRFNSGSSNYYTQYSFDGVEYVVGNELTLEDRGKYTIFVKSTNGHDVSRILTVGVEIQGSMNEFPTIFIIILIIAGFGIAIMLLKAWIKN